MSAVGALATAACLALAARANVPPGDDLDPGPRRGIDGRHGFESRSRVTFASAPNAPHELMAAYVFPDRARWMLRREGDPPGPPTRHYRFGARAWTMATGKPSVAFEGASREATLLQMELRRAAMLWPRGFAWEEAPPDAGPGAPARSAPVFELQHLPEPRELGRLEAFLDERGRANRLQVRTAAGRPLEELRILAWQELEGRSWPQRMELVIGDATIWTETVEAVGTRAVKIDLFFQPPDRRPGSASLELANRGLRDLDLSAITVRHHAFEGPRDWDGALARFAEHLEAARVELGPGGPALDPVPSFALDPSGRPTACLVRLASARWPAPEGWHTIGERPGVALVLERLEDLGPGPMETLLGRAPAGAGAQTPYCRIPRRGGPRGVQLYLPLTGEE